MTVMPAQHIQYEAPQHHLGCGSIYSATRQPKETHSVWLSMIISSSDNPHIREQNMEKRANTFIFQILWVPALATISKQILWRHSKLFPHHHTKEFREFAILHDSRLELNHIETR